MMNFWKQHNPNNITEKPPHYRSKSDGGSVLLYLDFLTVLEGEADIVSAVGRSTPTQSQRNRIFFETVKGILSASPFFSHLDSNMPLCYSAIPSRSLRRDSADLKGLGFPNKYFATQNGLCIYEDTACGSAGHIPFSSHHHKTFHVFDSIQTVHFCLTVFCVAANLA